MERVFIGFLIRNGLLTRFKLLKSAFQYAMNQPSELKHGFQKNKLYLRGFDALMITQMATLCFEQCIRRHIRTNVASEVSVRKTNGYKILLLSGSLNCLIEPMVSFLGADFYIGTKLEIQSSTLTGMSVGPHPYGKAKKKLAERFCLQNGFKLTESVSYGNEYPDAFLMNTTGEAVAVYPDKLLREWAEKRNWRIIC